MDIGPQTYQLYHRLQTELAILSRLSDERSKECKLDATGRVLSIQDNSHMWTSFHRWLAGDSRALILTRIRILFTETHEFLNLLSTNQIIGEVDNPARAHWVRDILSLCDMAESGAKGLEGLRQTYKTSVETDTEIHSLQLMVQRSIAPIRSLFCASSPTFSYSRSSGSATDTDFRLDPDAEPFHA